MKKNSDQEVSCPTCHAAYTIRYGSREQAPQFCVFCGSLLESSKSKTIVTDITSPSQVHDPSSESITLIKGHQPTKEQIEFTIGSYQALHTIGKGGMGEVFLAYDTTCGRRIALKRIRSDLMDHIQMHNRFLKEARITSQLTHPSIIPIYAIHTQDSLVYYTMPFVEGKTLKQILRQARIHEKKGLPVDHLGASIPALVRIFLSICQAIAYAHAKGVLHRDIKPENIIVGQYGEVLILDWGLAKLMHSGTENPDEDMDEPHFEHHPLHQLTNIGKVVGTVAYMAPERAMGSPATVQTDIYSLGVILYQILTLQPPFRRGTLKEFRESMHLEVLSDPIEIAPYREVPRLLARVATKCLSKQGDQRYANVNDLIHDIESYIEGRAEWFHIADLDVQNKADWEFQENVLIAEHVAITRGTDISDWVNLMISKSSFSENIKIEAKVRLGEGSFGLGFLLSIPEASQRMHLNDGYYLWLGTDQNRSTKLLRSTVEVLNTPDVFLQRNEWHQIRLEKIEDDIFLYINNTLQFSYISHIPLVGTHVGILARDADFAIKDFHVDVGSQNVMVNCLAVPDAFLAHKNYDTALSEYRRIGYSFPGRTEGREAMFRAGITLLEQARDTKNADLYDQALLEFEKLHGTPGAPLEYLGKALVYQALNEHDEEIKCFELAYRRYPRHPMLSILQEHIVFRMHSSSRFNRYATYQFILLVIRHLPVVANSSNAKKLFASLQKHWEPLPFVIDIQELLSGTRYENLNFGIVLAFWLAKPFVIAEIIEELLVDENPPLTLLSNALFCLLVSGARKLARNKYNDICEKKPELVKQNSNTFKLIEIALHCYEKSVETAANEFLKLPPKQWTHEEERLCIYLMTLAIINRQPHVVHDLYALIPTPIPETFKLLVDCAKIGSYFLEKNWIAAGDILHQYSFELLNQETTPLHFLYGCWLYVTEGKEIASIHFEGILDSPYPRSWTLFSHHYKTEDNVSWIDKTFLWERRQYFRQMSIYYQCLGDLKKSLYYQTLDKQAYVEDAD